MVSFSDGLPDQGSGIPYFYLTTLDPTARNALIDERASFTVSEYPLGTCGKKDPENPTCSKISLTGKVCEKINSIEYDYDYKKRFLNVSLLLVLSTLCLCSKLCFLAISRSHAS